jgi:predicted Zn-dependent protease
VVDDARALTIAGLPAYEVNGRLPSPAGLIAGRITWLGYRGRVYEVSAAAVGGGAHQSLELSRIALRSFRPLTPAERASVQVMRLHVVQAHSGETLGDVARRAGSALDLERTALANGVFPETALAPGTPVKVAVAEPYVARAAAH